MKVYVINKLGFENKKVENKSLGIFATEKEAENKRKEIIEDLKQKHNDLEVNSNSLYNDNCFINISIQELELNIDVWVLASIKVDNTETCEESREVFFDKNLAIEKYYSKKQKWINTKKQLYEEFNCEEKTFDEYLNDALLYNTEDDDILYSHYVYDEGEEKIFVLEKFESKDIQKAA